MFCDLHIHSCLSPCADGDMTVNNIVNMAALKGLDLVALTDHNSAKNCPAFLKAAERAGLRALPGMEINTAEEIHAVCLFKELGAALAFGEYVFERLPDIKNRPEIFGEQLVLDEGDNVTGSVEKLLINAAQISIYELPGLMAGFSGVCFPAHVDRPAYSLLSVLGSAPGDLPFPAFELADFERKGEIVRANPAFAGIPALKNSDAHSLWQIAERARETDERFLRLIV